MILYLLDHRHWIDNEYYDTKFIGAYSSQANALCTIEKYSQLPGFCDFKNGFYIQTVKINSKNRKPKKGVVYLLTITKVLGEDEITVSYRACLNLIFAKLLWIVRSIMSCGKHQKIYVEKHNIDEDNWCEGFVTIQ